MTCGAFLGVASFAASAVPIHVGLKGAAGSQSWTSPVIGDPKATLTRSRISPVSHGTLTLTGWEYDSDAWQAAVMTYKHTSPDETGLGVACNQTSLSHNSCRQKEIGATPWQMIDMNISQLTGWKSLTINLDSVNGTGHGNGGGPAGVEVGYLLGATCTVGGSCTSSVLASVPLASCTDHGMGHSGTCSFELTYADLLGITNIWVTPSNTNPHGSNNANILLGSDFVLNAVPEPAALGIFGFGVLLLGLFVGLRRRFD
jgi:hypothetical protein